MDFTGCPEPTATDVFFAPNASVCQVNVLPYLIILGLAASVHLVIALYAWRQWFARLARFRAKTRPPVAAGLFSLLCAVDVLYLVLPVRGGASYANGVPLLLLGLQWTFHITFTTAALRRYVSLGKKIFYFTDADLRLEETGRGGHDWHSVLAKLDRSLRVVFASLCFSLGVVLVLCSAVNLVFPLQVEIYNTLVSIFLAQTVIAGYGLVYQMSRIVIALKSNLSNDARVKRVQGTMAMGIAMIFLFASPAFVLFPLMLGSMRTMGSIAVLVVTVFTTAVHLWSVLLARWGKRGRKKTGRAINSTQQGSEPVNAHASAVTAVHL